jgi:hypothetical protein
MLSSPGICRFPSPAGALLYYFCSVQAIEQLRDAKFYSHKHWTLTSLHKRAHGTTA